MAAAAPWVPLRGELSKSGASLRIGHELSAPLQGEPGKAPLPPASAPSQGLPFPAKGCLSQPLSQLQLCPHFAWLFAPCSWQGGCAGKSPRAPCVPPPAQLQTPFPGRALCLAEGGEGVCFLGVPSAAGSPPPPPLWVWQGFPASAQLRAPVSSPNPRLPPTERGAR